LKPAASITRIVPFGQQLLCEILAPGDLALDLTAGNGQDILCLWKAMEGRGRILGLDIQPRAIEKSAERLARAGARVRALAPGERPGQECGVYLALGCHSRLRQILHERPVAVIANFGYLPGGDPKLITRTETSLCALRQAMALLQCGGRIALSLYPGHEGGAEEAAAVDAFFGRLPADSWRAVRFQAANIPTAPFVAAAQKIRDAKDASA